MKVDVYPVGLLRDWRFRKARSIRMAARYPLGRIKARDWRAVRNYFRNGWLTEHPYPCAHNAGWGWTKSASARRAEAACRR